MCFTVKIFKGMVHYCFEIWHFRSPSNHRLSSLLSQYFVGMVQGWGAPMQEAFWILCSDRIAANENNLEVVNQKLADEFLMDEKVRPFSKDSFYDSSGTVC